MVRMWVSSPPEVSPDGAQLNTKNGVILQIIDNDDALVGLDMDSVREAMSSASRRERASRTSIFV